MKKKITLVVLLFTIVYNATAQPAVKSVIFMIGDGMGLSQVYASATAQGLTDYTLFQAPYIGLALTYSASNYITDSAAGGTALATGKKTNNGMVGMTPDSIAIPSIMHLAKESGKSTGIVVTVPITHATPAAFFGHNVSRKNQEALARDFLYSEIDFFVGGGKKFFEMRNDSCNLSDSLRLKGYDVLYTLEELKHAKAAKRGAFLATIDLPIAAERDGILPIATEMALEQLSKSSKGFFLMIEGSPIEYQGHNNETESLLAEMRGFDSAIEVAVEFVKNNPGTLLVITADHETGGMVILDGDFEEGTVEATFNTDYHTPIPVPIFAFGNGAFRFTGVYENSDLFNKFKELMGL